MLMEQVAEIRRERERRNLAKYLEILGRSDAPHRGDAAALDALMLSMKLTDDDVIFDNVWAIQHRDLSAKLEMAIEEAAAAKKAFEAARAEESRFQRTLVQKRRDNFGEVSAADGAELRRVQQDRAEKDQAQAAAAGVVAGIEARLAAVKMKSVRLFGAQIVKV